MTHDPLQAASALRNAAGNHDDHTAITVPRWAAALGALALTDAETEQDRIDEAVEALAKEHEQENITLSEEANDKLTEIETLLNSVAKVLRILQDSDIATDLLEQSADAETDVDSVFEIVRKVRNLL